MSQSVGRAVLLIAALLLAGLLGLFLPWSRSSTTTSTDHQTASNGVNLKEEQAADVEVVREPEFGPPIGAPLVNWRDSPQSDAEFVKRFYACFYENGGQESMFQYVIDRTESTKKTASGRRVQECISRLDTSGLVVKGVNAALYTELVYGGNFIAGNFLSNNVSRYEQWLADLTKPDFTLPSKQILRQPLDYPPEMIIAYWSGSSTPVEFPDSMILPLSHLRDTCILQFCHTFQEGFMMEPCLNQVVQEMRLHIPAAERAEAYSHYLPEYDSINRSMENAQDHYLLGIRELMRSAGLFVIDF